MKTRDTDRIELYTTAPAAYDGFSTRELAAECGHDHRGQTVRRVSIERRDYDWQTNRYASGMHAYASPEEARRFPVIWTLHEESES